MIDFLTLFIFVSLKKDNGYCLSCWIELVLSPMLYKFIIWAYWAKTQSHIGSNPISVLTIGVVCEKNLIYSEDIPSTTFRMEGAGPY